MRTRPLPAYFVAEDDPNDMFLFTRLLKSCGVANPLHLALHGQEAIDLLARMGDGSGLVDRPGIVFLDERMPQADGLRVLAWLRERPAFAQVPVVLFAERDDGTALAQAARELGAQCVLRKFPSPGVMADVLAAASRFTERPENRHFELPANLLSRNVGHGASNGGRPVEGRR